ncbi:Hsp20/alpha crystallin family protein [Thioalkalivibrio sulfidiphilus]|uniref:Hsp20/alpha crystallin family protein n=1 Tax=Thioalkalivibrio sulfidiphilus TaxID=1033854 RepID=UPI000366C173|nr:Hsp20/alpha crystallin family protein [Thioalkalivibrio sulfidiphilus]
MAKDSNKKKEMETVTPSRSLSPFQDMERWFEESFPRAWMQRWGWPMGERMSRVFEGLSPRVNVIDRDEEIVVRAEVPGVKKEDLDISVTENAVTIKGSTKREEEEEKGDYYRREIETGAFARTVGLPGMVDIEKTKATFENGVLQLTLPKVSKAKRRQIKVE